MFGYYYYYGFDIAYIVLVLPCIILSIWASMRVNSAFKKYSQQMSSKRITGAQAAQRVLFANGIANVTVERVAGNLTDHFDPRTNVIRLSDDVYNSTSTAAIGVACHEAGHAVQYANSYTPMRVRAAILPAANIGSKLAMPLILLGLLFSYMGENASYELVYIGIALFGLTLLFQLVTLPVEFNASRRALQTIDQTQMLTEQERKGAKSVLSAAAMTYVAAAAVSLAQLLRLLMLFGNRKDD